MAKCLKTGDKPGKAEAVSLEAMVYDHLGIIGLLSLNAGDRRTCRRQGLDKQTRSGSCGRAQGFRQHGPYRKNITGPATGAAVRIPGRHAWLLM
jgi:hypothetical protein